MSGTLYGYLLSPHVARVVLVAKENNINDLKSAHVDLLKKEHKQEPFTNLNPFGTIPAYTSDDGVTLFESRAIAKYIDLKAGGKLLRINDPAQYGKIEAWAAVESGSFEKYALAIFIEQVVLPKFYQQATNQEVVDKNMAELKKVLAGYEKHFNSTNTTYLVGNDVSIADLFHLPVAVVLKANPDFLDSFPLTKQWFTSLQQRPSWVSIVDEQNKLRASLAK